MTNAPDTWTMQAAAAPPRAPHRAGDRAGVAVAVYVGFILTGVIGR